MLNLRLDVESGELDGTPELAVPREGRGPGLLLVGDDSVDRNWLTDTAGLMAEEGYVALSLLVKGRGNEVREAQAATLVESAARCLRKRPELDGPVGLIDFTGGANGGLHAAKVELVSCVVIYGDLRRSIGASNPKDIAVPTMIHMAEDSAPEPSVSVALRAQPYISLHIYPKTSGDFFCDASPRHVRPAAMIAYSRSLGLLRRVLGPKIDLEALWDEHLFYEFGTKDALATINTMVDDCYVNHIPNMTGGVGRKYLHRFYKHHFIPKTPDVEMIPISRTVGADRIVDEFVATFVHDREIDWLLPGVPPTGRRVSVPTVSIVCFRGRKLYHEHIYWDQASVLVQIGRLDPQGLPVAGVEVARKVLDNTNPSNELMPNWKTSEGMD